MKILITEQIDEKGADILRKEGFSVNIDLDLDKEGLKKAIGEYDGLIVRSKTKIDKEIIDAAERLKVIGRAGSGVDNIDLDAATKKGIFVTNCPGGNTLSAAEHTIAMLMSLARNIPQSYESMRNGRWDKKKYVGTELNGKTLGVLGLGKIGLSVAKRCSAFGMKIIAYDPFISKEIADEHSIELKKMDDVLSDSDFITLHLPLSNETRKMIGQRQFELMKPDARIINCARGGIIDEKSLYDALKNKRIAGAALDVFEKEPCTDSPLFELENVIFTPHLGASTVEAVEQVSQKISENIVGILKENDFANVVNPGMAEITLPDILKPYADLAEKIGKIQKQLVKEYVSGIEIVTSGSLNEYSKVLSLYVLMGILENTVDDKVNLVNAQRIAEEKGICITQTQKYQWSSFQDSITVKIMAKNSANVVKGTVFGDKYLRIIRINEFMLDFYPEKVILLIMNQDVPGVIGKIGTILGESGINIVEWRTGRSEQKGIALAAVNLDMRVGGEILEKINNLKEVLSIDQIILD
ncbi:MAG: phosphoglycerate dehydrogenase [Nanoarchaeota archaeon]|nr:phosphoglycerate dehydrogenase [Nanoarchaeota archaeon]